MPMDPQLAAIYGTNTDGEDIEKLAAADLAEKLAADDEAEVEYTDEQINELARAALGGEEGEEEAAVEEPESEEAEEQEASEDEEEGAEVKEPEEAEKTSAAEEAKEKIAEADYLGRVMAHAYTNELRKIASEQGTEKTAGKMRDAAGKVGSYLKNPDGKLARLRSRHGGKILAGGLAASHAAAAGAGHKVGTKKKASDETQELSPLDILAVQRAEAILKENGIEPEQAEKTSASEAEQAALNAAVEQRAVQMLEQAGYVQTEESTEQSEE
jgi:hypothetical protein